MLNRHLTAQISAVLDTSVIIAGHRSMRGASHEILRLWNTTNKFNLILSDDILLEWIEKLIEQNVSITTLDEFVFALHAKALLTDNTYIVYRITADPSDNIFLAAALEGQANYVVSLDKHLFEVKHYHHIQIVRPNRFLEVLRAQ